MRSRSTESLLGYSVSAAGVDETVADILRWVAEGDRPRWLACINPHSYAAARRSGAFASALRGADWLVPDGVGIVLASRVLGGSIRERVTGSDIFRGVHDGLNRGNGGRVFFLGSTDETLASICRKMKEDYPRIEVVGTYSPPFKARFTPSEIEAMVAAINAARADVLWVGMTAPKQEEWIQDVGPRLNVRFAAAVGAVFDFYIGRIKRSSPAFQRLGLEWLPRLLQEPRRLWRRTFVSGPVFAWHVLAERLRKSAARRADG